MTDKKLTPEEIFEKYKDRLPEGITFDIVKNMPENLVEDIALSTNIDFEEPAPKVPEQQPIVIDRKKTNEVNLESLIENAIEHSDEPVGNSRLPEAPVTEAVQKSQVQDESSNMPDPSAVQVPVMEDNDINLEEFLKEEEKTPELPAEVKFIDGPLHASNSHNMEVELAYEKYAKKNIRSTYFVVLPVSGYTANVRGLTIEEIDAIKTSYEDYFTSKDKIKEVVFNCIQSSSVPIKDLSQFKDMTAISEFKLLLFGIIVKTFGAVNNLEYNCKSCNTKNVAKVDINSILLVKDDELKVLIDTIMRSTEPQKEVDESVLSKVKRFELPDTKIVVDLAIPSFKRDSDTTTFFRLANKVIEESSIFNYMSLIKRMYLPHIQDDQVTGYITVNSNEDKYKYINYLTKRDRETINKVLSSYNKYDIDFVADGLVCKKCGTVNKVEFNVIENFLITVLTEM